MSRKKARNLGSLDWRRTLLVTLPFAGALGFWQSYDGIVPREYPKVCVNLQTDVR